MFKYQTDWQFPIFCQHQNIQIWDEAHHRDSWISYITIDADNMMWTLTKVENKGKSNMNLAHNVIVSMGKMIKNFFWIWKINPLARPRSLNHSVPIYRQTVCTILQTLHNFCLHLTSALVLIKFAHSIKSILQLPSRTRSWLRDFTFHSSY